MCHERDGLWVGVASGVRRFEGSLASLGHRRLLESLGRRLDLLILRTDLGQQQRAMLSDW